MIPTDTAVHFLIRHAPTDLFIDVHVPQLEPSAYNRAYNGRILFDVEINSLVKYFRHTC